MATHFAETLLQTKVKSVEHSSWCRISPVTSWGKLCVCRTLQFLQFKELGQLLARLAQAYPVAGENKQGPDEDHTTLPHTGEFYPLQGFKAWLALPVQAQKGTHLMQADGSLNQQNQRRRTLQVCPHHTFYSIHLGKSSIFIWSRSLFTSSTSF